MTPEREKWLELAVDIGRGLLENGAETYRVEETISHILKATGIRKVDVFAIPTSIITSISDEHGPLTRVERIGARGTDLNRVTQLNSLSRWIYDEKPDVTQARDALNALLKQRAYPAVVKTLGFALVAASFTLLFGGAWVDAAAAALCGMVTKPLLDQLDRFQTNPFFVNIIGGFLIAATALLTVHAGLAKDLDLVIIGTVMNLVPGLAITNSMRDIIAGDLVAGLTKLTEALIIGTAIALGTGLMLVMAGKLA